MTEELPKTWRRFILGLIAAGLHTLLVLAVMILVHTSDDPQIGMVGYIFVILDYPVHDMNLFDAYFGLPIDLPVFGGLFWFCAGWIFQSVLLADKPRGHHWLLASIASLTGLIVLSKLFSSS